MDGELGILGAEVATFVEAGLVTPVGVKVEVIGVIGPLVESGMDNIVTLDNPDNLLCVVIEIEFDLNVGVNGWLVTSELELLDEVLVCDLGEAAAFVSVKVDVVNKECYWLKGRNTDSGEVLAWASAEVLGGCADIEFGFAAEFKDEADFVVLKSNEGEGEARVSATFIPCLSTYLSGFNLGARLYLKPSLGLIRPLRPITI